VTLFRGWVITSPLTRRLLLDVDATLGVLTGLSAGITPLGVDILLYCLAVDDEGLIYKMRLRWRRGQQAEGGRGRSGGGRDANATPPDAGSVHLAKDCSCKGAKRGYAFLN